MRQHHHVLQRHVARIDVRLAVVDIEAGGRHLSAAQRGDQGKVVDQRAARGVGDDRAVRQPGDACCIQPMPGFGAARRVQRQHVADCQERVFVVVEDGAAFQFRRQPGDVAVMHLHPERRPHPRQLPADPAHAEDAEPTAGDQRAQQLRRRPAVPLARSDQPLAFARPARRCQDQQHGAFGGGDAEHVGRVADRDVPRLRRCDVDMVVADAEGADHLDAGRQRLDQLAFELFRRRAQDRIRPLRHAQDVVAVHRRVVLAEQRFVVAAGAGLDRRRQPARDEQDRLRHRISSRSDSKAACRRARRRCCQAP